MLGGGVGGRGGSERDRVRLRKDGFDEMNLVGMK